MSSIVFKQTVIQQVVLPEVFELKECLNNEQKNGDQTQCYPEKGL